jgi:hypothetical protein
LFTDEEGSETGILLACYSITYVAWPDKYNCRTIAISDRL